MRILIILTYYRPHTSGLTIYVERLSKALVKRGHQVTILTSKFLPELPTDEYMEGAHIVRAPVLYKISKGVIMPTFGVLATKYVLKNDIIHLHLPQFDAAGIAIRGRILRKPTVITYHCDITLPPSLFNRVVNSTVNGMNNLAAIFAQRIVTYTQDFADHSHYLKRFNSKVAIITPPVELPQALPDGIHDFSLDNNIGKDNGQRSPVIGMAARFAAEKGIEVLLDSLPQILNQFPNSLVLFAGQYQNVLDEDTYFQKHSKRIKEYQKQGVWKFLGILNPLQMASFYPNLDLLVVPSLNSTESFGLVQIEAMMNGVPVVASNLPGVRQPVKMTGMGEIAEVGDPLSLTQSILKVLENPSKYQGNPTAVSQRFSPDTTAEAYENLFEQLL